MWIGFKVFFYLNKLSYKNYMVEKEKNEIRFFPQHPGIYEN